MRFINGFSVLYLLLLYSSCLLGASFSSYILMGKRWYQQPLIYGQARAHSATESVLGAHYQPFLPLPFSLGFAYSFTHLRNQDLLPQAEKLGLEAFGGEFSLWWPTDHLLTPYLRWQRIFRSQIKRGQAKQAGLDSPRSALLGSKIVGGVKWLLVPIASLLFESCWENARLYDPASQQAQLSKSGGMYVGFEMRF